MGHWLRVTSRRAGFRRAGVAWPAEPVEVRLDGWSADQVEALWAEPMLTVEYFDDGRPGFPSEGADRVRTLLGLDPAGPAPDGEGEHPIPGPGTLPSGDNGAPVRLEGGAGASSQPDGPAGEADDPPATLFNDTRGGEDGERGGEAPAAGGASASPAPKTPRRTRAQPKAG